MICQKCGKRTATVHLKQVINGVGHEEYLCPICANTESGFFTTEIDTSGDTLFDALFSGGRHTVNASAATCPLCGSTARDIQKNSKAGCARCYDIFRRELKSAAHRIHGGVQHVGRAPGNHREEMERQTKIDELKTRQAEAIEEQNFELAAKLRDEIKALTEASDDGKGES